MRPNTPICAFVFGVFMGCGGDDQPLTSAAIASPALSEDTDGGRVRESPAVPAPSNRLSVRTPHNSPASQVGTVFFPPDFEAPGALNDSAYQPLDPRRGASDAVHPRSLADGGPERTTTILRRFSDEAGVYILIAGSGSIGDDRTTEDRPVTD